MLDATGRIRAQFTIWTAPAAPRCAERQAAPTSRSPGTGPPRAITLARFIPVLRTVMNPTAGVIGVPWRVFTLWQILNGLAWTIGITLAGYWLGSQIPGIDTYLLPIIAVIVAISLVPVGREYLRHRRSTTTVPTPTAQTPHQAAAVAAAIERNIP